MKRERIERLKEIYEEAASVMEAEWTFGKFREKMAQERKEAEAIFEELLSEAE